MDVHRIRYDRPRRWRGFTIMEIILVITLGLLLIVAGIAWFRSAQDNVDRMEAEKVLLSAREGLLSHVYAYGISTNSRKNFDSLKSHDAIADSIRHFLEPVGMVELKSGNIPWFHRGIGSQIFYVRISQPLVISFGVLSEDIAACMISGKTFLNSLTINGADFTDRSYSASSTSGAGFYVTNTCDLERTFNYPFIDTSKRYREIAFSTKLP